MSLTVLLPWVLSWFTKWQATLYGALTSGAAPARRLYHPPGLDPGRALRLPVGGIGRSIGGRAQHRPRGADARRDRRRCKQSYPSSTLLALRSPNPSICQEAARRAKGVGDSAVYVIYVDEIPGFLFPPRRGPTQEALRVLRTAVNHVRAAGIDAVPIWRLAHDAGASIAEAAEELGASCVFIGTDHRGAVWHFLQGSVLKRLVAELPEKIHVVICE